MSSLKEKSLSSDGASKKIRITLTSTDVKALEKGASFSPPVALPPRVPALLLLHALPRVAVEAAQPARGEQPAVVGVRGPLHERVGAPEVARVSEAGLHKRESVVCAKKSERTEEHERSGQEGQAKAP